jgi:hypothetical protein
MIINLTRGTTLCSQAEPADSSRKRAIGLMLRESLEPGHGLLMAFPEAGYPGIWMFLMRFPIDIAFISSSGRVASVVENARPLGIRPGTWRIYYPAEPVTHVLELPAGTLSMTKTRPGDMLSLSGQRPKHGPDSPHK